MIREISVNEISDGKRYSARDLVRLGCHGCQGCSDCCRDQGTMIILDPYDVFSLCKALQTDFQSLVRSGLIRIQIVDGISQPGLAVRPYYVFEEQDGRKRPRRMDCCVFLNTEGRCSIHDTRPGICRLFPLARLYENDSFSYILQKDQCSQPDGSKIRIKNWLGIPELPRYEDFVLRYHRLLQVIRPSAEEYQDAEYLRKLNFGFLKLFFMTPYHTKEDFYPQYDERVLRIRGI
ncbi:MAG: YkgJ family cysteine cluster protein [Lachnospiraceae bacterium]|nr:YkgJ family cysteine cluster protein [Lachnospiraceae bacterium]